jgi:hypothetical protein
MKHSLLVIGLVFLGFLSCAQEQCKDIIYTLEEGNIIFDCCVKEVKNGNMVQYVKDGDTAIVAATALIKDGQRLELSGPGKPQDNQMITSRPDSLYRGHDLAYYQDAYRRARGQAGVGAFFTFFGIVCELGGLIIINSGDGEGDPENIGKGLIIGGAVMGTIGIPILISGGVKRANNGRAIEEIERKTSLTFGPTNNGVGLTLSF